MNKIYWDNLGIEITRRCNMKCSHCMRGEAENIDIDLLYVNEVLKNTAFIGTIHFAGGEPSLNWKAINEILKLVKKYNIPVYSFDITTNGKIVCDEFIKSCFNWYQYCSYFEDIHSSVNLSIDIFHEKIPTNNLQKLSAMPFFQIKQLPGQKNNYHIVNLGRGKMVNDTRVTVDDALINFPYWIFKYNHNFYVMSHFVLTCNGNIVTNSDYEYNREKEVIFCKYNNLIQTLNNNINTTIDHPKTNFFRWFMPSK